MVVCTKDIGKTIKLMEGVVLFIQMVISMMVSGWKIKLMDMEYIPILMELAIKVNG